MPKIKPIKAWAVAEINRKGEHGFSFFDVRETQQDAIGYQKNCYVPENKAIIIPVLITPISRKAKK
ncbi:MAG: hypothetical protein WC477_07500 [Patescibacteria group bacterium]